MVLIRVLGPIDLVADDDLKVVPGRHERMLLGALATTPNRAVRIDDLAHMLWGDEPPHSSANAIQTYISRLRAVTGHDRITSVDHSYRLHATADDLDALRFEKMVAQAAAPTGDSEGCRACSAEALRLWRGEPFGEFADEDPFRLEVIRLEELRLLAIEINMECELALSHGDLVVGRLEVLVDSYPYRERLWELLIAALAESGRRVEALRACQKLRVTLGATGLDPSKEIAALEDAILRDEPLLPKSVHC